QRERRRMPQGAVVVPEERKQTGDWAILVQQRVRRGTARVRQRAASLDHHLPFPSLRCPLYPVQNGFHLSDPFPFLTLSPFPQRFYSEIRPAQTRILLKPEETAK